MFCSDFVKDAEEATNFSSFASRQEDKLLTVNNSLISNSGSLCFNFAILPDFIPHCFLWFSLLFSPLCSNAFSVIVLTREHLAIKGGEKKRTAGL